MGFFRKFSVKKMSFCRDLCEGLAGNVRNCMTTPITRTKLYWAGGITLFIILFIVILCVSLPSGSSETKGRQALSDAPFCVGMNYKPSESHEKKVSEFDKASVSYVKESPIKVQIFGARADCNSQFKDALPLTVNQVDYLSRLIPALDLKLATSVEEIKSFSSNGAVSVLIAVNGGHSLGLQLSALRTLYRMGVRIVSITSSNCTTPWAKSAIDQNKVSVKSTDYRQAVVREMNRLGMMIDIAGVDVETQGLIIDESVAPVVAIGIGLKSIKTDPLNLDQNIVAKFKSKGGLLMLSTDCNLFAPNVTSCYPSNFTRVLKQAKDDQIKVGIAGAFKADETVAGLSFKEMPAYFDSLYKEGFSMDFLKGISGDNFLQTLKAVEDVAKKSQKTSPEEMLFNKTMLDPANMACYTDVVQPTPPPQPPSPNKTDSAITVSPPTSPPEPTTKP